MTRKSDAFTGRESFSGMPIITSEGVHRERRVRP